MRKTYETNAAPRCTTMNIQLFFLFFYTLCSLLLYVPHLGIATAPRTGCTKAFRCRSLLESAEVYRKKAFFDFIGFPC